MPMGMGMPVRLGALACCRAAALLCSAELLQTSAAEGPGVVELTDLTFDQLVTHGQADGWLLMFGQDCQPCKLLRTKVFDRVGSLAAWVGAFITTGWQCSRSRFFAGGHSCRAARMIALMRCDSRSSFAGLGRAAEGGSGDVGGQKHMLHMLACASHTSSK